jgi:hypothetical protein
MLNNNWLITQIYFILIDKSDIISKTSKSSYFTCKKNLVLNKKKKIFFIYQIHKKLMNSLISLSLAILKIFLLIIIVLNIRFLC